MATCPGLSSGAFTSCAGVTPADGFLPSMQVYMSNWGKMPRVRFFAPILLRRKQWWRSVRGSAKSTGWFEQGLCSQTGWLMYVGCCTDPRATLGRDFCQRIWSMVMYGSKSRGCITLVCSQTRVCSIKIKPRSSHSSHCFKSLFPSPGREAKWLKRQAV